MREKETYAKLVNMAEALGDGVKGIAKFTDDEQDFKLI